MPYAERDGTKLFFEDTGTGQPILFLHEFGGDARTWAYQVRYFTRRYRCIVAAARGYLLPSGVLTEVGRWAVRDLGAIPQ